MHADKIYQGLVACLCVHNHTGHTVTKILCDQQFATIMNTVKDDLDVHMNYTSSGEHESVAERNISQSSIVSYPFSITYHSELSPRLW